MSFEITRDQATGDEALGVALTGHLLLDFPLLSKDTAFSEEERREFGLQGLLPPHVDSLDEQAGLADTGIWVNWSRVAAKMWEPR